MKQDRDWIDAMRNSLRDAELKPPAGGWERLSKQLPTPAKVRGSLVRLYWPRIAAAAAAVIMFVVAGDYLLHEKTEGMTDGNVIVPLADGSGGSVDLRTRPEDVASKIGEPLMAATNILDGGAVANLAPQLSISERLQRAAVEAVGDISPADGSADGSADATVATVSESQSEPTQAMVASVDSEAQSTAVDQGPDAQTSRLMAHSATRGVSKKKNEIRNSYQEEFAPDPTSKAKVASVAMFAAGGMMGGKEGMAATRLSADGMIIAGGSNTLAHRDNYSSYSFRHRLPLSFGLSVRKDFKYGLSVESGVNYTLLSSDVQVVYGSKDITQKLHFIGVPLRLNWSFLERNRFSLYASAGGALERCVSAKLGSRKIEEDKLQWSAMGAVGAQYRLGAVVGIYFEPELSYYFTQTQMRTSRTDSPLSVTLRIGLRINL